MFDLKCKNTNKNAIAHPKIKKRVKIFSNLQKPNCLQNTYTTFSDTPKTTFFLIKQDTH